MWSKTYTGLVIYKQDIEGKARAQDEKTKIEFKGLKYETQKSNSLIKVGWISTDGLALYPENCTWDM